MPTHELSASCYRSMDLSRAQSVAVPRTIKASAELRRANRYRVIVNHSREHVFLDPNVTSFTVGARHEARSPIGHEQILKGRETDISTSILQTFLFELKF